MIYVKAALKEHLKVFITVHWTSPDRTVSAPMFVMSKTVFKDHKFTIYTTQ